MFLGLVGLVSVCAKFWLPSLSKSGLKVPGGVVVGWLRPILMKYLDDREHKKLKVQKNFCLKKDLDGEKNSGSTTILFQKIILGPNKNLGPKKF